MDFKDTTLYLAGMGFALPPHTQFFCELVTAISGSWRGQFWFIIGALGWKGWLMVIGGFAVWTIAELIFGGNSANGFSWRFNVAVGSLTFTVFQTLILLILSGIFGDGIYCLVWPIAFHLIPFALTGIFWRWTGFWPY